MPGQPPLSPPLNARSGRGVYGASHGRTSGCTDPLPVRGRVLGGTDNPPLPGCGMDSRGVQGEGPWGEQTSPAEPLPSPLLDRAPLARGEGRKLLFPFPALRSPSAHLPGSGSVPRTSKLSPCTLRRAGLRWGFRLTPRPALFSKSGVLCCCCTLFLSTPAR